MTTTNIPTADLLRQRLEQALQPTQLEVIDESYKHEGHAGANGLGYGTHFRVRIAAPAFAGQNRVACHRLVYGALGNEIQGGLHALAIEVLPA